MSERKITITHGGVDHPAQIAEIKSTFLGINDHGIMSADLTLGWPHGGISVGGYTLDTPAKNEKMRRVGTAFGLDMVIEIMNTVGVSSWEKLKGQSVLLISDGEGGWGSRGIGIAHLTDAGKVLIFKEHVEAHRAGVYAERELS